MKLKNIDLNIIGVGRVGLALAKALNKEKLAINSIVDRNAKRLELARNLKLAKNFNTEIEKASLQGCVFICVPDDEIFSVAAELAQFQESITYAFHFSGLHDSEILKNLKKKGTAVGSIHPVQTLAGEESGEKKLAGIYWVIEGDKIALFFARELIKLFQGKVVELDAFQKKYHHLACSLCSNYLNFLISAALQIYEKIGVSKKQALEMISPLCETSLKNIMEYGLEDAITGPAARGDLATMENHLEILENDFPALKEVYKILGRQIFEYKSVLKKLDIEKVNGLKNLLG